MVNFTELLSNDTDLFGTGDVDFTKPYWRQITWSVLFTVISVVGTVGNLTIVWVVVVHQNMRSVTNLFLVNLAIADGLVALLDVPFVSYQLIHGYWPFGRVVCIVNEFFAGTNIGVSILTLSMISIDRYQAIMYPFKCRMGRGKTITIMVGIWLVSIVILSPNWLYITTIQQINKGGVVELCVQLWPDPNIEEIYRICLMIALYFLPLVCIGFSYNSMAAKLWGYGPIGEQSKSALKKKRAIKRIVKMLVTVVIIFAVCWLPIHLIFIADAAGLPRSLPLYFDEVSCTVFWMAMSNSMYNPIIYCLMNARFRAGFRKAYRWCPGIRYDPILDEAYFASYASERKSMTETK